MNSYCSVYYRFLCLSMELLYKFLLYIEKVMWCQGLRASWILKHWSKADPAEANGKIIVNLLGLVFHICEIIFVLIAEKPLVYFHIDRCYCCYVRESSCTTEVFTNATQEEINFICPRKEGGGEKKACSTDMNCDQVDWCFINHIFYDLLDFQVFASCRKNKFLIARQM